MSTVTVIVRGPKRSKRIKVTCDYYRVTPEGALALRRNKGGNAYPETVALFAAGHWMEVHREAD